MGQQPTYRLGSKHIAIAVAGKDTGGRFCAIEMLQHRTVLHASRGFYLRDGYRLDKTSLVFEKRSEENSREPRSSPST
jgi:hypothetical protein